MGTQTIEREAFQAGLAHLPGDKRHRQEASRPRAELERLIDLLVAKETGKQRGILDDPEYHQRLAAIRARAARQERELIYGLLYERIMQDTQVTEEDLRSYYNTVQQRFLTTRVHLRHLVVDDEAPARAAYQRLMAGEPFGQVAGEVSSDPTLRAAQGDMGLLPLDDVPVALRSKALALQAAGDLSTPFQVQGQWHILQLVGKDTGVPRDFAEVRDQLARELQQSKANVAFQQMLAQQRQALGVEINESVLAQFEPPVPTPSTRPTVRAGTLTRPPHQAREGASTQSQKPRQLGGH